MSKADFERVEIYEATLRALVAWADAYPVSIFPEPDLGAARKALEKAGLSLDGVAASCMRHVVDKVAQVAQEALDAARK